MNFKRYIEASNTWVDSHYIMGTDTDTLTTLPAVLYPNDTTATVGLKGNMSQSSQPSPTTPIQPQECGERTGNLFDDFDIVGQVPSVNNGNLVNSTLGGTTSFIKMGSAEIVLSYNAIANIYLFLYDNDSQFIGYKQKANGEPIYSTSISGYSNAVYCRVRVDNLADFSNVNLMLNLGSTPLPYEPYGVKIPISSANTTTPVYLGEVETTRKIQKLVLTGEENFNELAAGLYRITENGYMRSADTLVGMCSHFGGGYTVAAAPSAQQDTLSFLVSASGNNYVYFSPSQYLTISDFKSYLAQQYANGTPVTVWYVLATPQTAVVNEPLMRIGDYADTLSGITIPTIAGANAVDVLTTLKPSEVTVNYKGWHTGTAHERENGAWT